MEQQQIKRLASAIKRAAFTHRFTALLTPWLLLLGSLVLLFRFVDLGRNLALFIGFAGLLAMIIPAWRYALARTPSDRKLRAYLDQHNDQGGLLMAAEERSLGAWRLKSIRSPKVRPAWGSHLKQIPLGLVFVAVCFLLPQKWVQANQVTHLDLTDELTLPREQIELLEENELISEVEAEQYRETLDTLEQEASGDNPSEAWETLDHLAESLNEQGAEASTELQELAESLEVADQLTEQMANSLPSLDGETAEKAMQEMNKILDQMARENSLFAEARSQLDVAMQKQPGQGMDAASKQIKMSQEQMEKLAQQMQDSGLMDKKTMDQIRNSQQSRQKAQEKLSDYLDQVKSETLQSMAQSNSQCDSSCSGEGQCSGKGTCDKGGKGGQGRGPGYAPLTWKDEATDEQMGKFKEKVLRMSEKDNLEKSLTVGMSVAAPSASDGTVTTQGNALEGAKAGGGAAYTNRVLPGHRAAVRRYFDRSKEAEAPKN